MGKIGLKHTSELEPHRGEAKEQGRFKTYDPPLLVGLFGTDEAFEPVQKTTKGSAQHPTEPASSDPKKLVWHGELDLKKAFPVSRLYVLPHLI